MGNSVPSNEKKVHVKLQYSNGDQYVGEQIEGQKNGKGTYTFSNGDRYEGEWLNDMKYGKGTFYYSSGELYIGQWKDNKKNGFGKYFYQKGERYIGHWKNNMRHGNCKIYLEDGSCSTGSYFEHKKNGPFDIQTGDGSIIKELWEFGVLIKKEEVGKVEKTPNGLKPQLTLKKSATIEQKIEETAEKQVIQEKQLNEVQPTQQDIEEIEKIKQEEQKYQESKKKIDEPLSEFNLEHDTGENLSGERKDFDQQIHTDLNSAKTNDYAGEINSLYLEQFDMLATSHGHLLHKNIKDWNGSDVEEWLKLVGLAEYAESFSQNHITGKNLFDVTESELKEDFKMVSLGHRLTFKKSIENLKKLVSTNLMSKFISNYDKEYLNQIREIIHNKEHSMKHVSVPSGYNSGFGSLYYSKNLSDVVEEENMFDSENQSWVNDNEKNQLVEIDLKRAKSAAVKEEMAKDEALILKREESLLLTKSPSKRSPPTNNKTPRRKGEEGKYLEDFYLEESSNPMIEEVVNKIENKIQAKEEKEAETSTNQRTMKKKESLDKIFEKVDIKEFKEDKNILIRQKSDVSINNNENSTANNIIQPSPPANSPNNGGAVGAGGAGDSVINNKSSESSTSTESSSSTDDEKNKKEKDITSRKKEGSRKLSKNDLELKRKASSQSSSSNPAKAVKKNSRSAATSGNRILKILKEVGIGVQFLIDYKELEFIQKSGEGAYGEVYRGKWLGQEVAIKQYGKSHSRFHARKAADFIKEAEVISKLSHPNIVLYMGVCINYTKYLMITEFLEGGSLFDLLHKSKTKLSDDRMLLICEDIALGMNYLHGRKVFHCDLKSGNILIDAGQNIKICDFGLSRLVRQRRKKKIGRVGTPHWMAPEIMRGENYDESSDVYSYGMIIWEMMTGEIPYQGLAEMQIMGKVGFDDYQVPLPKQGNPLLIKIMRRCLNKNRNDRPTFSKIVDWLHVTNREREKKMHIIKEIKEFFGE